MRIVLMLVALVFAAPAFAQDCIVCVPDGPMGNGIQCGGGPSGGTSCYSPDPLHCYVEGMCGRQSQDRVGVPKPAPLPLALQAQQKVEQGPLAGLTIRQAYFACLGMAGCKYVVSNDLLAYLRAKTWGELKLTYR